ncbi:MAG: cyclase family protein [Ktedonobacteraceae bacterium]|nr:cyclase family protein [Ktedonobacteraceae bacterium]
MDFTQASRVYDLEQPRYFGAPVFPSHAPGFVYSLHRRHEAGTGEARTSASGTVYMAEHSGTHIDALCHQAEEMQLYGGQEINPRVQTSVGFTELGVETIPPLIARGVLLDVAAHRGVERIVAGSPITRRDLEATAQAEEIAIGEGDIVMVRTGNDVMWHDPVEYLRAGGVSVDASSWLASLGVRGVGADNMAWDEVGVVDPELKVSLPGHLILLVRHGIYIIENLNLEEMARDRCYESTLVVLPLKMRGATGSPVRPIALTRE